MPLSSSSDGWKTLGRRSGRRNSRKNRIARDNAAARTPAPTTTSLPVKREDVKTEVKKQAQTPVKQPVMTEKPKAQPKMQSVAATKISELEMKKKQASPDRAKALRAVVTPKAVVVSSLKSAKKPEATATQVAPKPAYAAPKPLVKPVVKPMPVAKPKVLPGVTKPVVTAKPVVTTKPVVTEVRKMAGGGSSVKKTSRPTLAQTATSSKNAEISIRWTPRKKEGRSPSAATHNPVVKTTASGQNPTTPALNPEAKPFTFPLDGATPKKSKVLNPTAVEFRPPPPASRVPNVPRHAAPYHLLPHGLGPNPMAMHKDPQSEGPVCNLILPYF